MTVNYRLSSLSFMASWARRRWRVRHEDQQAALRWVTPTSPRSVATRAT
ncbi:carboxylesterase family protein [Saccharothrix sp. MB29]|nr:carboxylesterase family protein [Saccharothrix sp. MB29]